MKKSIFIIIISILIDSFIYCQDQNDNKTFRDLWQDTKITETQNTGFTSFPVLNIIPGGMQEALQAYTSRWKDGIFLDSNSAVTSVMDFTNLAFYYKNLIADINMETLFISHRIKNIGFGAGVKFLHTSFTRYGSFAEQVSSSQYIELVGALNFSYNIGKNYYFDGVALGANVKFAYRSISKNLYQDLLSTNQSAYLILFDLGALTRFSFLKINPNRIPNMSVGVSLNNLGPTIKNEIPYTIFKAGFSWDIIEYIYISADLLVPINIKDIKKSEKVGFAVGIGGGYPSIFNAGVGFSILGGNPKITLGINFKINIIDLFFNYNIDLTTNLNTLDNFSIGISFNIGDNDRKIKEKNIDDLYVKLLNLLANGRFDDVIYLADEILKLDKKFIPAKKGKEEALKRIASQNRLEKIKRDVNSI